MLDSDSTLDEAIDAAMQPRRQDGGNSAPGSPPDALDAAVDAVTDTRRQQLRQTLYGAIRQDSGEYARARDLSRRTGIPAPVVLRNRPDIEHRVRLDDIDGLASTAPRLADRLANDRDFAALSHDDAETLAEIERTLNRRSAGVIGGPAFVRPSGEMRPTERGFFGSITEPVRRGLARGRQGFTVLANEFGLYQGDEAGLAVRLADQQRRVERFPIPENIQAGLGEISGASTMGRAIEAAFSNPRAVIETTLESLGVSLPILAGAGAGSVFGPGGTAAGAGAGSFAMEYSSTIADALAESGATMTDAYALGQALRDPKLMAAAREKGVKRGIPIAAFDALTAGLAGRLLAGARPTAASIGLRSAGELGLQAGGGAAGEAAAQAVTGEYNPGAIVLEALAEIPGGIVEAPLNVREYRSRLAAQVATQDAEALAELSKLAVDSKLRGRDAALFADIVQQSAEAGGRVPSSVFIDGAVLANALAQEGKTAETIKAGMPSLDQLDAAVETQGMVEIPVGEFAAHLTGKPYTDTLLRNLRTDPEAPTLAEANAYLQSDEATRLHDEIARLANDHAADMVQSVEQAGVKAIVAAQLDQVGRFSQDANRAYAELHAAFFSTMAERLGTSPAKLFEEYRANIAGEALPGAPALDQGPRGLVERVRDWLAPRPPAYAQGERGAFVPREHAPDGKPLIALLKNADLSTFLHESGHYFLENYADMAKAAPALQQDMQTLLAWFGVPDAAAWQGMNLEQRRQHHEKFARGFEQYLYEGRAPSLELQGLFARFRAWLMRVYKTLRGELTDEVRAVMDRMLAIDSQIKLAEQVSALRPLFRTAEEAQQFGLDFAEYQGMANEAKADALAGLESRSLRNMRWLANAKAKAAAGITHEAAQIRKGIEAEVRAEVEAQSIYRAMRWLKKGEMATPGGEEVKAQAGYRLSIPALKGMYPADSTAGLSTAPAWTRLGYGAAGMLANDGLHPDLVAEMFGFTSGDQLVRELLDALPVEQMVEALTDRRMIEEHGDMADADSIERAAEASIHNQARQRMVAAELAALQNANRGHALLLAQAARDMARRVIGQAKVGALRPRMFTVAAAKAARAAEDAVRRGDIEQAIAQKRTQLLNNALARQAFEAKDEIAKAETLFREVAGANDERTGRTHNLDLVNAARAILAEYGAVTDGKLGKVARYMEALRAYDPELYAVLEPQIAAAVEGARPLREITVDHFRALRDQVDGLWYMSRRSKEVEIDGRLMDRDEITAALGARLDELGVPLTAPGEGHAVTEGEKRVRYLQGARAALRRVEHWVDRMDGGKITGAFRSYLWNPISEAADRYRSDSAKYLARYRDLLKAVEPSLAPGKIEAPELGYTFGHTRGGMGKVELLHAILHTGNESNMRKLLLGRGWGVERADGTVDAARWDAFIRRLANEGKLTQADFDFVQGVWDLLEEIKPLAQKTHREVFGRYFDEVTAQPVVTPFGTYRGGYVPALVDTFTTQDAAVHAELEAINQGNGYLFPATNRGFTRSRVEYNRPLLLDLRTIGQHIDKVLLFSHMEGRVRDVVRILKAKGFAGTMSRYDPVAYTDMLLPWLNRAARQTVETPTTGWAGKLGDRFFRTMRTRAGMAAMFANVTNALQQITGLSIAALKVKPRHLAAATVRYIKAPGQMAKEIAELSPFMAQRQHNETMAMRQEIEQLLVNPSRYDKAQAWAAKHGYFLQAAFQNVVDSIVWAAAYDQSIAAGESEGDAIRSANSAVRETQGSLSPEDVSRWETGPAFVRLFTQFQGYFNMQANILGTEFAKVANEAGLRKGAGRLFYIYLLGFMAPAVVAEAIVQGMKGGPGDDDDDGYLDEFLAVFFGSQFRTAAAMVPVVGQMSVVAANAFNRKPYDDRMSTAPAVSMIESAASAPHSVYKAIAEEGSAKRAIRDTLTLVTITTGLPVSAFGKPLGYVADMEQGRVEPSGPVDAVRGAISGAASPGTRH
ncbi:MAG: hypothetical protein BroJett006_09450 [Betaproteobacteria bacterium]|nr:MAG: hypothetical protein BroJett006_09450 [Betaproteobacteria bacterium]